MTAATVLDMQLWDDAGQPRPDLPAKLNATWVSKQFREHTIDTYMRSHLSPQAPADPDYMRQWRLFWRILAFGDKRARTVIEKLERWREAAERNVDGAAGDTAVVRRFHQSVVETLNRVRKERGGPLGWAEPQFAVLDDNAAELVEQLAVGIIELTAGRISVQELHGLLRAVRLDKDPRGIPRRTQEEVRALAKDAAGTSKHKDS
ncbi:hypothetical protein BKG82_27755 [Mycobacteroides chelonae]|uniref:Uncharacterized protein n=1 Tax=Mycobacteroides chelonae TaxID=1774 RepID=A0A1S1LLC9_MYCCH|nr:hypothetical protein [Mycobacteroides chelonae]OHU47404.1 hypothetical protein BKG82_27755 [Mycobacteroides chelonae]